MSNKPFDVSYITSHKGDFYDLKKSILSVYKDLISSPGVKYEHLVCLDGYELEDCPFFIRNIPNVKILNNKITKGKSASVNYLISIAQGEFLFFLDSDDYNLVGRTYTQLSFHRQYKESPQLLLGSNYLTWNKASQFDISNLPLCDQDIKLNFWSTPNFLYSTMSCHHNLFHSENFYFDDNLKAAIDYEFYSRIFDSHKVMNISQPLVIYTINTLGITRSQSTRNLQLETHLKIIKYLLRTESYDTTRLANLLFEYTTESITFQDKQFLRQELLDFSRRFSTAESLKINYFPRSINNHALSKYFYLLADSIEENYL